MKVLVRLCVLVVGLALAPASARALSLALAPATITATGSFSVDLIVSGLGGSGAPSLGTFDVGIGFDPSFLGFTGASFGSLLGAVPVEAIAGTTLATGLVDVAEISLLAPAALDALQSSDSFTLATLSFDVLPGSITSGALSFGGTTLGDAFGRALAVASATGATVSVAPAVPEPAGFLVFATGVAIASRRARRDA